MVNRPGEYDIRLKPIKALPAHELEIKNPTLKINGQTITFETTIKSRTFLEFDPETNSVILYDLMGNVLDKPIVIGNAPILEEGKNIIEFTGDCDSPYQKRVAITLRTAGEPL